MTMKAAVYRSFNGPIRIESVPKPTVASDGGVIVKVMATGVCRSDWHGWKGHDGDIINHGLPFIPGHEFSGIITGIGNDLLQEFEIGDRVTVPFILSCGTCYCCRRDNSTVCTNQKQPGFTQYGSFAEYILVPRALRNVIPLPKNVSFSAAAALGCRFTTAYRATIQQGHLSLGQSVAVFGCGGLGLSCVMLSKAAGASLIIACDVSPQALQKALEIGATHIIQVPKAEPVTSTTTKSNNNNTTIMDSIREQIIEIIQNSSNSNTKNSNAPDGTDLTIDAAGFTFTCECAIHCTRRAGTMVQVGLPTGPPPQVPMGSVVAKELKIIGSHGFPSVDLPMLLQMISNRQIDPTKLIEKRVSLWEGAKAIENMDYGSPLGITMITSFHNDNDHQTNASSNSSHKDDKVLSSSSPPVKIPALSSSSSTSDLHTEVPSRL